MGSTLIKELKNFGLSRSEIARLVGVNESTVGRWENGSSKPSTTEENLMSALLSIAKAAKTDAKTNEALTGILNLGTGQATGIDWMKKYGSFLAIGGVVGVLGGIIAEFMLREKTKRK